MWQLLDQRASLSLGPIRARLDLAVPENGIHEIQLGRSPWAGARLLCVEAVTQERRSGLALLEAYVRGSDLVATYAPPVGSAVQPQIYWRARSEHALDATGVELVVSVQTNLLDSRPSTRVSSILNAAAPQALVYYERGQWRSVDHSAHSIVVRADEGAAGMWALATGGEEYVYVEMVHPIDFESVTLEVAAPLGRTIIKADVFREHLEKGVIRRARFCGWFLRREHWQSHAEKLLELFRDEPLPLTT